MVLTEHNSIIFKPALTNLSGHLRVANASCNHTTGPGYYHFLRVISRLWFDSSGPKEEKK